jgi:hypothetical protein
VSSKLVVALSIGCAVFGGCRFDRSPLSRGVRSQGVAADAAVGTAEDAALGTHDDAAASVDAAPVDIGATDAGTDAAAASDAAPALDAAVIPEDSGITSPPMNGGLSCGGSFCAFGLDPEKPCCTTPDDVTSHAARLADRCGLDLSALPGKPYGQHCWQRDQLGIVDNKCPSAAAGSSGGAEPGCCGDDGTCGTLNADHKLGCRHDTGAEPRACAMQGGGGPASCDPLGTYGMWISVDAAWGGRSGGLWDLTDDGRGNIEVFLLAKITDVDAKQRITSTGRVCGVRLPAFYSTTLCEAYQPNFPIEIWESQKLPPLTFTGRYECAASGCVLSIDPQTYLLGFDANNPEAPWPAAGSLSSLRCPSGQGVACFPDHDSDGKPGVGVTLTTTGTSMNGSTCRGSYMFRGAPLSASVAAIFDGVRRTDRLELGVRTKLGGSTRFANNCDKGDGSGVAEYVNSRAAGCLVQSGTFNWPDARPAGDAQACDATESQFLDENLPTYALLAAGQTPNSALKLSNAKASPGPQIKILRLGDVTDAVSCAQVRDAKY